MNKKAMSAVLTGTMLLGISSAAMVIEAAPKAKTKVVATAKSVATRTGAAYMGVGHGRGGRGPGFPGMAGVTSDEALKELKKEAAALGIKVDGKDVRTISQQVFEATLKKEATSLGIKTDGKTSFELSNLVAQARLKKEAAELGIKVDGKSMNQVAQLVMEARLKKDAQTYGVKYDSANLGDVAREVQEKKILAAAEKLGVATQGRFLQEVMSELVDKHADKLDEYGLGYKNGLGLRGLQKGFGLGFGPDKGRGGLGGRW